MMPPVPIILRWPRRAVRSKLCGIAHLALKLPPSRERANDPTRRRSADVAGDGVALVFLPSRCSRQTVPSVVAPYSPAGFPHRGDRPGAGQGGQGQGRATGPKRMMGRVSSLSLSLSRSRQGGQARPDQGTACLVWPSACLACVALRTEQTDTRATT